MKLLNRVFTFFKDHISLKVFKFLKDHIGPKAGKVFKVFKDYRVLAVFAVFAVSAVGILAGAGVFGPGEPTRGRVRVSHPQVFTRERLIAHRYDEYQRLSKELDKTPEPSFQGLRSREVFERLFNRLDAALVPPGLPSAASASAEVKPEQLAALDKKVTDLDARLKKVEVKGAGNTDTVESTAARRTTAELSSVDRFHDGMAYREVVRASLKNQMMDDTHDINGKTMYDLRFDVVLIPGEDSREFVEIELELEDAGDNVADATLYRRWISTLDADIREEGLRMQRRFLVGQLDVEERVAAIWLAGRYEVASALNAAKTGKEKQEREAEIDSLEMGKSQMEMEDERKQIWKKVLNIIQPATGEKNRLDSFIAPRWDGDRSLDPSQWRNSPPMEFEVRYAVRNATGSDLKEEKKAFDQFTTAIGEMDEFNTQTRAAVNRLRRKRDVYHAEESGFRHVREAVTDPKILVRWAEKNPDSIETLERGLASLVRKRYEDNLGDLIVFEDAAPVPIDDATVYPLRLKTSWQPGDRTMEKAVDAFKTAVENLKRARDCYVTVVEPKEYAQNISAVEARRDVFDMVFSLGATMNQFASSGKSPTDYMKDTETLLDAIERQPLAIGFGEGSRSFGWILGPRFKIENGRCSFVHVPVKHSYSASLVAPAWWEAIKLKGTYRWVDGDGESVGGGDLWRPEERHPSFETAGGAGAYVPDISGSVLEAGARPPSAGSNDPANPASITVELPGDMTALTAALLRSKANIRRRPEADNAEYVLEEEQADAAVYIRGRDLWRNPQVYIDSQRADEVEILPDMNGLLARFDRVLLPAKGKVFAATSVNADLRIVTSVGEALLPNAVTILKKARPETVEPMEPFAQISSPAVTGTGE